MIEILQEITLPIALMVTGVTIALLTFLYRLAKDASDNKRKVVADTEERLRDVEHKQVELDSHMEKIDLRLENIKSEYEKNRLMAQENFNKLDKKLDNLSREIIEIFKGNSS